MSWEPEIDELEHRRVLAEQMGGTERVERQHRAGRLTVRERIESLLDRGSFREIGSLAGKAQYDAEGQLSGFTPANCVVGRGKVMRRPVVVSGDDFTVAGGSADAAIWDKFKMAETMAREYRMPLIRLVEGSGGGGSVRSIEKTGFANLPGGLGGQSGGLHLCCATLAAVPVVGLALGPVAGLGAARVSVSHLSIMVREKAQVFVAGPPVVEKLGEKRTKEELGGHAIQLAAGTIDMAADDEEEAFALTRRFLSYLPDSVWELPPRGPCRDSPNRACDELAAIVPRDPRHAYLMRRVIDRVVDRRSFFEMGPAFGRSVITGLARLDGWPVALMAGDPLHSGGAWTAASAQKIMRFVDLAETFHLPVVHLVDCPGFVVGLEAEKAGTMRHAVRALAAIHQSTVPWCSVLIRNVYGVGGGAHQPQTHHVMRFAWPSGRWGSLPMEGGIEAAYRAELAEAKDPDARRAEITARLERLRSPFRTAEAFGVDEIIDPRDTRRLLCEFAGIAAPLRKAGETRFPIRP